MEVKMRSGFGYYIRSLMSLYYIHIYPPLTSQCVANCSNIREITGASPGKRKVSRKLLSPSTNGTPTNENCLNGGRINEWRDRIHIESAPLYYWPFCISCHSKYAVPHTHPHTHIQHANTHAHTHACKHAHTIIPTSS